MSTTFSSPAESKSPRHRTHLEIENAEEDEQAERAALMVHPAAAVDDDDDSVSIASSSVNKRAAGTASNKQVAANMVISFVGAGLLGMPYAFAQSGWLLGTLALAAVSTATVYAMLLLVKTRRRLEAAADNHAALVLEGYGDVARVVLGERGEFVVNVCLIISQVGFATAYIIFCAANITSIFASINRATVCFGCVPILCLLIQARDMKTLSPFSLLADVANACGLLSVFLEDMETEFDSSPNAPVQAFHWSSVIYVMSISIYSLEGVGLILSLESSSANPENFPRLLKQVLFGITSFMALFGCAGYMAYGSATLAPITLNLTPGSWVSAFVKLMLCLALYLTYPIMMFPIHQIMEPLLGLDASMAADTRRSVRIIVRSVIVVLTAFVAWSVPDFGKFLSLVGASICTILGFIFPCIFHLKVFRKELQPWQICLDGCLILGGFVFGAIGTYDAFHNLVAPDTDNVDRI